MVKPNAPSLLKAYKILEYSREATASLLKIYDGRTATRGRGAPSTEEQNLLRAMVVLAGAGLDAALKQVAQDALHDIVGASGESEEALATFTARTLLRGDREGDNPGVNTRELSRLLVSTSPRAAAISAVVADLANHSLQSLEQLAKTLTYFGASKATLNQTALRSAFGTRNRIVHEMDMDLQHPTRKRKAHERNEMVEHAEVLLRTACEILVFVDGVLARRAQARSRGGT